MLALDEAKLAAEAELLPGRDDVQDAVRQPEAEEEAEPLISRHATRRPHTEA